MSLLSTICYYPPISWLRKQVPHSLVNTIWHYPKALSSVVFYGFPSGKLKVIGVTGSKGKTTVVHGIYHLLKTAGKRVAMISTVEAAIGKEKIDTGFHVTSPDPWHLQKLIRKVVDQGFEYLILEATSHGLAQHRLLGVNFDIGVLTNIQPEHLDYHADIPEYIKAKSKLFKSVRVAILNQDDSSYKPIINYIRQNNFQAKAVTYGIDNEADIVARKIRLSERYSEFICQIKDSLLFNSHLPNQFKIRLNQVGKFNLYNTLAIIGTALIIKIPPEIIQKALASLPQIPGRMELINHQGRKIVIDFAHTPDSMEQVLNMLKSSIELPLTPSLTKRGKSLAPACAGRFAKGEVKRDSKNKSDSLITVFGCAGLRDTQKRPLMGKIAAKYADIIILTAEDPRTEDVNGIIDQIAQGCIKGGAEEIKSPLEREISTLLRKGCVFLRIPDRQQAINVAIQISNPGDTIAILGKGHEKSMCFGTNEVPWSDQKAVQQALSVIS